jgi:hypothetical protein
VFGSGRKRHGNGLALVFSRIQEPLGLIYQQLNFARDHGIHMPPVAPATLGIILLAREPADLPWRSCDGPGTAQWTACMFNTTSFAF